MNHFVSLIIHENYTDTNLQQQSLPKHSDHLAYGSHRT